jgi:pyruvate kinase
LLADYRPRAPIVAVVPDRRIARRLTLQWGVSPVVEELPRDRDSALRRAEELARRVAGAQVGDAVLVLLPLGANGEPGKAVVLTTVR